MDLFRFWAAARLKSARTLPKTPPPRNGAIVRTHATFRFVINDRSAGVPPASYDEGRAGRPRSKPNAPGCRTPSEMAVGRAPEDESAAVGVTKAHATPCADQPDSLYRLPRRRSVPPTDFQPA